MYIILMVGRWVCLFFDVGCQNGEMFALVNFAVTGRARKVPRERLEGNLLWICYIDVEIFTMISNPMRSLLC